MDIMPIWKQLKHQPNRHKKPRLDTLFFVKTHLFSKLIFTSKTTFNPYLLCPPVRLNFSKKYKS